MVEWKKLGDVCEVLRGKRLTKSQLSESEGYPVLHGGSSPMGFYKEYNRKANTTVVVNTGNAGSVFFYDKPFWSSDACYSLYPNNNILDKFLYLYVYGCEPILKGKIRAGAMPTIDANAIKMLEIPIPSLEEQKRIVGILDTFTDSIENLKQQIAQRRKQYEHYRDQLLDLEGKEGVEWKKLNTVCEVINGRAYKQQELLAVGKYRVLRVGNFFSNDSWYFSDLELDDKYYCNNGDLLYAWSASFGPHIWTEEKTIYHYHIWKMNCSEELDKKYMFYWLQSENMRKQAFSHLHGATMAHLTKALMESLNVPLLPLSDQQHIVSILDTFEESIKNLEAQLAQRQKQYEYYRNQLLTFE